MGPPVPASSSSCVHSLVSRLGDLQQYSTWQLFLAHSIPQETIIPILQLLKYRENLEALSCLLLQLRREKYVRNTLDTHLRPTEEMVRMVLSRPCHPEDQFTTRRHWASNDDNTLGEHIKAQLSKRQSKLVQLTLEQILELLDNLKPSLSNKKDSFLTQTLILQALQHLQSSCDNEEGGASSIASVLGLTSTCSSV